MTSLCFDAKMLFMLKSRYIRTTISLPKELMFEIKKKALIESKTLKDIIQEGLRVFLRIDKYKERFRDSSKTISKVDILFGSWGKGESGVDYVRKFRNTTADKRRNTYLKNLWKESS